MTRILGAGLFALALAAAPASGQQPTPAAPAGPARGGAPSAPADFAASINNAYTQNKNFLLASADKWPADQFGWRPAGLEAELRTFGQILAHIANEHFTVCSRVLGQPAPRPLDDAKGVFTQAEAKKALQDGFALCDPLYRALTNQNVVEMMSFPGRNNTTQQRPRGTLLIGNVAHSNEQYGQIMIYFALKGLVPPSHDR
jgi:hypothetical protein